MRLPPLKNTIAHDVASLRQIHLSPSLRTISSRHSSERRLQELRPSASKCSEGTRTSPLRGLCSHGLGDGGLRIHPCFGASGTWCKIGKARSQMHFLKQKQEGWPIMKQVECYVDCGVVLEIGRLLSWSECGFRTEQSGKSSSSHDSTNCCSEIAL